MSEPNPYHEALQAIKQLEIHIDKLQTQIDQAKEAIAQVVARALTYDPSEAESRKGLLWELYWKHRDYVKGSQIAEILGVRPNQLRAIVGEAAITVPCCDCGKDFKLTIKSRAHLQETISAYNVGRNAWKQSRCDECEAKSKESRQAASAAYWEADRKRQERRNELHTMPYADYLQTPEWNETRQRLLKRARYRCSLCNKQGKLNVHHRTYERRGYEDDKDLIVLCGTCHAKFHDKLPEAT